MTPTSQTRLTLAILALAPTAASAQGQATPDPAAKADIVVTGTSAARTAHDTPVSISTLDTRQLRRAVGASQADLLATLPSIKTASSGGEVGINVFFRGLPLAGPYQLTPLQYDGIPVLGTNTLTPSSDDVYYRNDLGIERLEFVRGGVSNLFGAGSVAGLVNYISRTGGDARQGIVQLEVAERGRVRADAAVSGPLSRDAGLYYALSGYYRRDDGPIRTGLATRGGQLRGNLRRAFADGSGSVTLYAQYIDDRVQFYPPFPLDGVTRQRVPGNDGAPVASLLTDAVAGLGFARPGGRYTTQVADGVVTRGGQLALVADKDLGDGWAIGAKARYARYAHRFGFFLDGDGVANVPETQAGFLARRSLPADAAFTYAATGAPLPAGALLYANRLQDRIRPTRDVTAELDLTKALTLAGARHTLTLGGWLTDGRARDRSVTLAYLGDFANRPQLVDLVVRDPAGRTTIVARDGLLDAGLGYTGNLLRQTRQALYLADQIERDRLVLDIGTRVEWSQGAITRATTATTITDATTPGLSSALRDVMWETGATTTGTVRASSWALSAGALYRLTPSLNLYANANRGFFFPALYTIALGPDGRAQSYEPEKIRQAEIGAKYALGPLTASLAAFANDLKNRRTVLLVNTPGGGLVEQVTTVSTRARGVEAVLALRLARHLRVDGNASYVDHAYTALDVTPQFVGNRIPRQPTTLWNAALAWDDDTIDASIATTHTGAVFTDTSNTVRLDAFDVVRLVAGYTYRIDRAQSVRLGIDVFNLLDGDGIADASPRQLTQTIGAYFIGRPILPRRVTARLSYSF